MHYGGYVILDGPCWYFERDSQQSVACHISPQASHSKEEENRKLSPVRHVPRSFQFTIY